jgi:hypothetical protein
MGEVALVSLKAPTIVKMLAFLSFEFSNLFLNFTFWGRLLWRK